jgi:hypothetical protein
VLDLSSLNLETGNALAEQTGGGHQWLINPQAGEAAFWTAGMVTDGQPPGHPDLPLRPLMPPDHGECYA